ncbi:hypothetical protein BHE74_00038679, partial [Ensete ventricosum]
KQSGEAAHLHPGPVSGRRSPDQGRNGRSTARVRRAHEGSDVGEARDASHRVLSSLCTLSLSLSPDRPDLARIPRCRTRGRTMRAVL